METFEKILPEPATPPLAEGEWRQTTRMRQQTATLRSLVSPVDSKWKVHSSEASTTPGTTNAAVVSDIYEACLDIFASKDSDANFRVEARSDSVTYQRKSLPKGGSCLIATIRPVNRSVAEAMARFEVSPDDFAWANEHLKIWQGATPEYDIQSFKVVSDTSPNDQVFYVVVKENSKPMRLLDLVWLNSRHPPAENRQGIAVVTSIPIETAMCPEKPELERMTVASGGYVIFPLGEQTCGISRIVYSERPPAARPMQCLNRVLGCCDLGSLRSRQRDHWIKYMHCLKQTIETVTPGNHLADKLLAHRTATTKKKNAIDNAPADAANRASDLELPPTIPVHPSQRA